MAEPRTSRSKMVDGHLVYIRTPIKYAGEEARYDVYRNERGPQLGWVIRDRHGWRAVAPFGKGATTHGPGCRTRWEATTALWGRS